MLVYSNTEPPHDYGGGYHSNLAGLFPSSKSPLTLWNEPALHMAGGVSDFRVSCRASACDPEEEDGDASGAASCGMSVDLAFYDNGW